MTDKQRSTDLLDGAYGIETPEDSVTYYKDFAAVYDRDFATALGYAYPGLVAEAFRRHAGPNDTPVADIGCGTGLVAEALALGPDLIEGFDISPEMLAQARAKGLYACLHEIDLARPIHLPHRYGALVSAGTFTHGHLGPEPLENLLTLARPGALFVIGVNAQHYRDKAFAPVLARLETEGRITAPELQTVEIFTRKDTPHGADTAQILTFRAA